MAKQRVLIYRLGSLGDTVVALPSFHRVRQSFPDADITLLTNRPVAAKAAPVAAVLGPSYFYDRVLDYPVGTRNPYTLIGLLRQIRALRIDTVVDLTAVRSRNSTRRDRLFFRLAGVRQLIGFPQHNDDFELLTDPQTGEYEWEASRLSRRLRGLGDTPLDADEYWNLNLTDEETEAARLAVGDGLAQRPLIALSAGTKMQSKDWEADNWLTLIGQLRQQLPDWGLVMIGAPDEAELAERCLQQWGGAGVNLCGKTSPRVSAAVLKQTRLFVGHDSGPMHLAACVGIPCVAIFSARNLPRQWFPRGNNNRVIYHRTECAGCNLDVCIAEKKRCILSIRPGEVLAAVQDLIYQPA